jgi:magnesium transporter
VFRKLHPTAGSRPGTLIVPESALSTRIQVTHISKQEVTIQEVADAESLDQSLEADQLTWVHVQGLKDVELLQQIAEHFGVHPLALEDVVNVPQRPKYEVTDHYVLAITRGLRSNREAGMPLTEQVSVVLGKNFVLSFQESYHSRFEPVFERLKRPAARLRALGPDYLAYVLLDIVIDSFFPLLETVGEHLDRLEAQVLTSPQPSHLKQITEVKRDLISLRRTTWAQREMVGEFLREDSSLATDQVRTFTRDMFDHCVQIADVVDMYRESATGLVNTYLSSVGQRTNDIMKTLTIVGSIFIPLTFLAGIYGMNFEHMPELHSRWAYPAIWGLMGVIAIGMVGYFYRCGWLGGETFAKQVATVVSDKSAGHSAVQTGDWDQQKKMELRRKAA